MTKSNKIKVIIADDHAILRAGLKQILAETDDIVVIAEAENAAEAIKLGCLPGADVILMDIAMPDRSGMDALKYIKHVNHQIAVLMLSMYREDQYAVRALKSGAAGYVCKQTASSELVNAIRVVAKGKKYISSEVAEILANQVGMETEKAPHESLSDREFQTMTLIASGFSVGEIAEKLALSVKTISMYRTRLLEKLNLRHNAELTHYAIKNHLVD
ncbi:MAG: response regulator transcription factor [Methylotenera sp.]|uniref:response regulator transcription factor n=1 Tax=Methylotenera sp. TaxID=2051956 RepID=UPI00248921B9|nr:response regulator transcription factor [Methylotenera sp.]MDI1308081.1 response regulator transcription factor [Methylotenera sp.]